MVDRSFGGEVVSQESGMFLDLYSWVPEKSLNSTLKDKFEVSCWNNWNRQHIGRDATHCRPESWSECMLVLLVVTFS